MRKLLLIGVAVAALAATPSIVNAQERAMTGAAIGAGAGAIVAGPVGAVAGGAVGAIVGGPRIKRIAKGRYCWRDRRGYRHCRWR